jgi:hypothetical protein
MLAIRTEGSQTIIASSCFADDSAPQDERREPETSLLGRLTNRIQYEQEMARVRYSPEQADLL